jgi:hypothetical protein
MITYILIAILVILTTIVEVKNGVVAGIAAFFGLLFFETIIFLFCNVIVDLGGYKKETYRESQEMEIFSIKNVDTVSGCFFLGSGYIGGSEFYYTFIKDSRGGYNRWSVNSNYATLFMSDIKPKVSWQVVHYGWPKWFCPWSPDITKNTSFDIIVPVGTIIEKYDIK